MKVTVSTEVELSVDVIAEVFAHLDDDAQAQFFVKVAAIADRTYTNGPFRHAETNAESQWLAVGNHLRQCECSTERAREMIRTIRDAMEGSVR